jgi:hypothetical protein
MDWDFDDLDAQPAAPTPAPPAAAADASWDDDDWEKLDPELEAARKAQEEAEQERAREQLRKDKAERKQKAEIAKEVKKTSRLLVDDFDEDEADIFRVETASARSAELDFQAARDALGILHEDVDASTIDIGVFQPQTVPEFDAYHQAVVARVSKFPFKGKGDRVALLQYLVNGLTDSYRSSQLKELQKSMLELYNQKLGKPAVKKPAAGAASEKTFIMAGRKGKDDVKDTGDAADFDDFM